MPDRFPTWVKIGFGLTALAVFLAAGCANSQQEKIAKDRLELARTAYLEAKSNRNVEAFAPLPFAEAGKALQAAEQAKNAAEKEQLAYVAEKRSKIAWPLPKADGRAGRRPAHQGDGGYCRPEADPGGENRQKEAENARLLAMAEGERAAKAKKEAEEARSLASAEAERATRAKPKPRPKRGKRSRRGWRPGGGGEGGPGEGRGGSAHERTFRPQGQADRARDHPYHRRRPLCHGKADLSRKPCAAWINWSNFCRSIPTGMC